MNRRGILAIASVALCTAGYAQTIEFTPFCGCVDAEGLWQVQFQAGLILAF